MAGYPSEKIPSFAPYFHYPNKNDLFYHQNINDTLRNLCKKADIPITMHA